MKKFIPFLSLAFLVTACTSSPKEPETKTLQSAQPAATVDTAGLAAFQQWKTQNELVAAAPVEQTMQPQPQAEAPVRTVTVIREVRVQQPARMRKTVKETAAPVPQRRDPMEEPQPVSSGAGDVATNTGSGGGSGTGTVDAPAQQPETAKKEGMSNATKGAVLGGAGGAVIGAVLNKKNRGVGAVIGGVVGGAVGYGLGKKKDNKGAQQ
jgi:hypothetical protein